MVTPLMFSCVVAIKIISVLAASSEGLTLYPFERKTKSMVNKPVLLLASLKTWFWVMLTPIAAALENKVGYASSPPTVTTALRMALSSNPGFFKPFKPPETSRIPAWMSSTVFSVGKYIPRCLKSFLFPSGEFTYNRASFFNALVLRLIKSEIILLTSADLGAAGFLGRTVGLFLPFTVGFLVLGRLVAMSKRIAQ
jgi:hypothetical protein